VELASLEIRIARSENLPVLPQSVSSVLRLADSPSVSPRQIAQCIERDPAITAKVLRAANSAYYGFSNVNTVGRAISCLGMNSIRSLVISVALQNMLAGRTGSQSFNKTEFWKHSLAVGIACRVLGTMKIPAKADEIYSAGMMHDVGFIALDRFLARDFDDLVRQSKASGSSLTQLMQVSLGFDQKEVGSLLAERWKLPAMMKHAILFHERPQDDGDYFETTAIVSAANTLAHQAGFTLGLPGMSTEFAPGVMEGLGLPMAQYEAIGNVMVAEVERAMVDMKLR